MYTLEISWCTRKSIRFKGIGAVISTDPPFQKEGMYHSQRWPLNICLIKDNLWDLYLKYQRKYAFSFFDYQSIINEIHTSGNNKVLMLQHE